MTEADQRGESKYSTWRQQGLVRRTCGVERSFVSIRATTGEVSVVETVASMAFRGSDRLVFAFVLEMSGRVTVQ